MPCGTMPCPPEEVESLLIWYRAVFLPRGSKVREVRGAISNPEHRILKQG